MAELYDFFGQFCEWGCCLGRLLRLVRSCHPLLHLHLLLLLPLLLPGPLPPLPVVPRPPALLLVAFRRLCPGFVITNSRLSNRLLLFLLLPSPPHTVKWNGESG